MLLESIGNQIIFEVIKVVIGIVVGGAVGWIMRSIIGKYKKIKERNNELTDLKSRVILLEKTSAANKIHDENYDLQMKLIIAALQECLKRSLNEDGKKYIRQGWCTQHDKSIYESNYKIYHKLGKNGVMTDMYTKVVELPFEKTIKKSRSEKV